MYGEKSSDLCVSPTPCDTEMLKACEALDSKKIEALIARAEALASIGMEADSLTTPLLGSFYKSQVDRLVNEDYPILLLAGKQTIPSLTLVLCLVEKGANPNVKDENGRAVLHHIVEQACRNSCAMESYIRDFDKLFADAAKHGHSIEINSVDFTGKTPIQYALQAGSCADLVNFLLVKGAKLPAKMLEETKLSRTISDRDVALGIGGSV